jgi:hypothetical protein
MDSTMNNDVKCNKRIILGKGKIRISKIMTELTTQTKNPSVHYAPRSQAALQVARHMAHD